MFLIDWDQWDIVDQRRLVDGGRLSAGGPSDSSDEATRLSDAKQHGRDR